MTDLETRRAPGWTPDLSTFGARLAVLRQAMGWTNIKEAAVACAIAPETWRRWEAGRFEPRGLTNVCIKISGVTGVDYRWLALGPDSRSADVAQMASSDTLRYTPTGERLVTVGMTDRAGTRPVPRSTLRTRPIDAARMSTLEIK